MTETGWHVYRFNEYLGYIPDDGTPGTPVERAVAQYEALRQEIDSIDQ